MNTTKIWNILLLAALLSTTAARAENRFFFSEETVLTESNGNALEVLCDSDELTLGFSYAIRYNPDELEITAVTNEETAAAEADYFTGRIDQDSGRLGYGCVYDVEGIFDEKHLPAGTGHRIGLISFNTLLTEPGETALRFESTIFPPNVRVPVRNILTDGDGRSIVPSLEEGRITVITAAPEITSIEGGSGEAGQVFQVSGRHLDREGLAVSVCGADAEYSLRADGETIDVTAPACENTGCVPVVISTVRGSDEAAEGFCYNTPPRLRPFSSGEMPTATFPSSSPTRSLSSTISSPQEDNPAAWMPPTSTTTRPSTSAMRSTCSTTSSSAGASRPPPSRSAARTPMRTSWPASPTRTVPEPSLSSFEDGASRHPSSCARLSAC